MAKRKRTPEENERRARIWELLQLSPEYPGCVYRTLGQEVPKDLPVLAGQLGTSHTNI